MAQTQGLQRRVKSVRNVGQITKAMEVVAASRMRRVQAAVAQVRAYGEMADSIMRRIAPSQEAQMHPYFKKGSGKVHFYLIFSSDSGLAGAYNSNVFNKAHQLFIEDKKQGLKSALVIFGRRGASHFAHVSGIEIVGEYEGLADMPDINVFAPVMETIQKGMEVGDFNSVTIIYTKFVSSLVQKVEAFELLPVAVPEAEDSAKDQTGDKVYEFEPGIETVLEEALRLYFESKFMSSRVEAAASEYAMRVLAMGNASRNAKDLIDNLTLELNSLRQAAITQEIAEITGGAEAIAV